MNDVFPAIERRFNADETGCVRHCRKLFQFDEDDGGPRAYATWETTGGENLDTFGVDITQHDGEFTLYSAEITAEQIRKMADAITRTFDDQWLDEGSMASISTHRNGPPVFVREDSVYMATIEYTVFAELSALTPAVRS